ncbi:MAG: phosphatidate cytidylyltransferase [Candidatus Bathyarchaeota archaeon]|nr:phosphatidate cytidylyltransferase [Candidatus Bathyarchaeota archaeon A05DMB-5]MDH7557560.1 phosphatidate cytidylyltransferase [Candidatus Bathyarchaeota archaeon]
MIDDEIFANMLLMLLCYFYILLIIFVSSKMDKILGLRRKASRKFLHIMIGNLPFIIPFFTSNFYPFLVAVPFIPITFLASAYSPFKNLSNKMKGLTDITEEGHQLGLVFYAISYTVLALLFASKQYVMVLAARILPMAYGDAVASVVGEKFGKRKYGVFSEKSLEGSAAMFLASFSVLTFSLFYFSLILPFSFLDKLFHAVVVAAVTTLVEGFTPLSFDNLTVPAFGALVFFLLNGGV